MPDLVVGFDLDMTLVDSRPGIAATLDALAAESGVFIDSALVTTRLGPPLALELANWYPHEQIPAMNERFRVLYPELAVAPSELIPGAVAAIEAVRRHGGRVVVVTGKHGPNAELHLRHLGLEVDVLVGGLHGERKAEALLEHGVQVYVGDHPGDIAGARVAQAVAVGVASGSHDVDALTAAGADVALPSLETFPGWLDEWVLARRLERLDARLRELGSVAVAFSGGADSAFVLAAAARALGPDRVVAVTAVSPSLPQRELAAARAFVADLGVRHETPSTDEMSREGYRANAGDRCFFCKAELLEVLAPMAERLGVAAVATGTNADDVRAGFRPGIRAAAERGAVTPLLDAGFTKAQVREASRRWGLVTWDKPAAACLSSRVAFGVQITPQRLARVEAAEDALRDALADAGLEVRNLRVRDLGERARIEVDRGSADAVAADPRFVEVVREAGFAEVTVDLRGFRSGSMNELLADPSRYR
ncbi:MAG TPA: ATP-dependent sacrificial sulfur transferase LarE [Actinomycetes bacterium]|nr:ATP-dependent sacrificial sulfur transferase LarE [Actinomycetes bacterium]